MTDDFLVKSEYFDDGVRFGTGPEMIAEIKLLRSRITSLESAIQPFARSPLSTEPEAMRTRLFSFEDHDAKIQAARDALESPPLAFEEGKKNSE